MEQDRYIRQARQEFAEFYHAMNWLSPGAACAAQAGRQELLDAISAHPRSGWRFSETKLYTDDISPGCVHCGQGTWSCLFINGICNARCFYCPSEQNDPGPPVTSAIEFEQPGDYADYVNRFGIRGVAFSGGEPLISFDRVLKFLEVLGRRVRSPLHIWMYTNGILADTDRLKALRDNGLKEIRFDLSAVDYSLGNLKKAIGLIPVVSVEIPAIPEDLDRTKPLLKKLYDMGVNYLNLHQIRCTRFNAPKLIQRGYTFLHRPGVAVLDTELAALELIRHSLDENIALPVNYCSFTYRNLYQKAAARRRNAALVKKAWEDVTATGFIRAMTLSGDPGQIAMIIDHFKAAGVGREAWMAGDKRDCITFPGRLWPWNLDLSKVTLKLKYSATALRSDPSMRYPHTPIQLNPDRQIIIETDNRHPGIVVSGNQVLSFAEAFLASENPCWKGNVTPLDLKLEAQINRFETFPPGLAPYM